MTTDGATPSEHREQTDQSLRIEREQVDEALAETQGADEEHTNRAVRRARESADAVLINARDKADLQLERALTEQVASGVTLAEERQLEDERLLGARIRADVALTAARLRADELLLDRAAQVADSNASILKERRIEDAIRDKERALADLTLHRERADNARNLAKLLPLERERTDRDLLVERARSDAALSNRDEFLAMVCHDLRSLLGGIVMGADLLAANAPSSAAGQLTLADTAHIQRYAARMNRLIGDLIDVVSIDAGKLALIQVRGDVREAIAEAVASFAAAASEKGIALTSRQLELPMFVDYDRERVLQVLANLISNALKFTARGGSISVVSERREGEFQVSVRDTGCGIASELLEVIFERFWQVGTNDRHGLGLGLYIARCIVEGHGGRIWAESELGKGSSICFTLPEARPVATA